MEVGDRRTHAPYPTFEGLDVLTRILVDALPSPDTKKIFGTKIECTYTTILGYTNRFGRMAIQKWGEVKGPYLEFDDKRLPSYSAEHRREIKPIIAIP